MTERTGPDPAELWKQWYETGSRMWTDMLKGPQEDFLDPYGLYRQWFEGMENMRERINEAAQNGADRLQPSEVWRKWFDASVESWHKSTQLGAEMMGMAPRWIKMMEQTRDNMMSVERPPTDPLQFFVHWYNATSGPVSEFVHDSIEREEFLEPASRWLQSYASIYKVFRRNAEEYLKTLQIPSRSDITRVASLVVALEEKVDRIEETFEEFEYGYSKLATEDRVEELEKSLNRVERKLNRSFTALESGGSRAEGRIEELEKSLDRVGGKLDKSFAALERGGSRAESRVGELEKGLDRLENRLNKSLAALEKRGSRTDDRVEELEKGLGRVENKLDKLLATLQNGDSRDSGQDSGRQEIKATDAARRRAQELGVNLAEVRGTGADGQITVGDVRRKGES